MSLSIFCEKALMPNDEMLAEALGESKARWDSVKKHVESTYKNIGGEWKFYSKDAGWTFAVKSGKRTLLYLIPLQNGLKAGFVLGERATGVAQGADLPEAVLQTILEAKQYVEGRSFMMDVKDDADITSVTKLLKIKNEN